MDGTPPRKSDVDPAMIPAATGEPGLRGLAVQHDDEVANAVIPVPIDVCLRR